MKKIRVLCLAIVTTLLTLFTLSSCMIIQSQRMKDVTGTYELTSYTYTPSYQEGQRVPATINYIQDRGYKVYLVVTGNGSGYYVHSDNSTPAYSVPVVLSYEYDQEDSSKVSYVNVKKPDYTDYESFGVTKDSLNRSTPSITVPGLFGLPGTTTESLHKAWRKVDKATDLSYVKEQFEALREHTAESYIVEGLYEIGYPSWEVQGEQTDLSPENPYYYYYVAVDSIGKTATVAYLEKAEGSVAVKKSETVVLVDGWNTFKVGDLEFKKDQFSGYYYCVSAVEGATDGSMIRWSAGKHSNLSETYLDELISNNTPQPAPEVTPEETA